MITLGLKILSESVYNNKTSNVLHFFLGLVVHISRASQVIDPSQACFRVRNQIGSMLLFMFSHKKETKIKFLWFAWLTTDS